MSCHCSTLLQCCPLKEGILYYVKQSSTDNSVLSSWMKKLKKVAWFFAHFGPVTISPTTRLLSTGKVSRCANCAHLEHPERGVILDERVQKRVKDVTFILAPVVALICTSSSSVVLVRSYSHFKMTTLAIFYYWRFGLTLLNAWFEQISGDETSLYCSWIQLQLCFQLQQYSLVSHWKIVTLIQSLNFYLTFGFLHTSRRIVLWQDYLSTMYLIFDIWSRALIFARLRAQQYCSWNIFSQWRTSIWLLDTCIHPCPFIFARVWTQQ